MVQRRTNLIHNLFLVYFVNFMFCWPCISIQFYVLLTVHLDTILCSVDSASRYNGAKKNQLDSQLILSIFREFYVLLTVHLDTMVQRKANLIHKLFLVYFVNLYTFRAYLGPSSGGTTVCTQKLVLIVLFRWLSNTSSTTDSHLKKTISTNCCIHTVVPPDDGPRYARNM